MEYVWYITPEQYEKAEENGISRANLNRRVRYSGWDIERAMTEPLSERSHWLNEQLVEKAKKHGINRDLLYKRLKNGMDEERASTMPVMTPQECGRLTPKKLKYKPELLALAKKNDISYETYRKRVKGGMDETEAATRPLMNRSG